MRHLCAVAAASAALAIAGCGSDSPRSELRLQDLDALMVSDILVEGGDAEGLARIEISCQQGNCSGSHDGETESFSLEEMIDGDDDGDLHDREELEQIPRLATRGGVAVYHASETDTSDPDGSIAQVHAYGGWLDHGAFFILATTLRDPEAPDDAHVTVALSIGDTGKLPVSGSATWTGAMVGVDYGRAYGAVTADAELRIPDLSAPRVDVAFTRMSDGGADMRWAAIPVNNSSFRRGEGADRIEGTFYGPGAKEVGGIFERNQIIGAFGAKR